MRIAKTKVENKQAGQQRRSTKTVMVVRHSSCEASVAIMIWGRERQKKWAFDSDASSGDFHIWPLDAREGIPAFQGVE